MSAQHTSPRLPRIRVPASARSFEGFRRWMRSPSCPERGRFAYLDDAVLADMSPEELETHNKIKMEVSRVIANLSRTLGAGTFYGDGTLLTNRRARLSTEPDGLYVRHATVRRGRVHLTARPGRPGEYLELVGSPDWVLEVVSRTSIDKDESLLREAYARAGIEEYWLINALGSRMQFRILRLGSRGYEEVKAGHGWRASPVFDRRFRLVRGRDRLGLRRYTLAIRP